MCLGAHEACLGVSGTRLGAFSGNFEVNDFFVGLWGHLTALAIVAICDGSRSWRLSAHSARILVAQGR